MPGVADMLPRVPGVGDLVSDVQGLYYLSQANDNPGGVAGFLSTMLDQFDALPGNVRLLQGQITRVAPVLEAAKADTTALGDAQRDLAQITAQLPATQTRVRNLMLALAPILPELRAGTASPNAIASIAGHGVDVVQTFNAMNTLFSLRSDAETKIQRAVTNPQLTPSVAQSAATALAAGGFAAPSNLMKYALIAVAGYVAFRVFTGRGDR